MSVKKYIENVRSIRKDLPKATKDIVLNSKTQILDLIRNKQLFEQGIDGRGRKLKPYTDFTVAVKIFKGQDPNTVTLFDTGDFYKGFDLVLTDQFAIGVFSRDVKTPDLIEKYGPDIFTFTDENNRILNEEIVLKKIETWLLSQLSKIVL